MEFKTIICDLDNLRIRKVIKSENFNPLIDVKLLCTCGHPECDKRSLEQRVLDMLQCVRYDYGLPMVITSAGRCQYHPNEIHRDEPADHQKQRGVDVKINGLAMAMKLMAYGIRYGFNAFGINLKSGFIHMGYRPELVDKIATWVY